MKLFFVDKLVTKISDWQARKRAKVLTDKNLLVESRLLQEEIDIAASRNISLGTLKELIAEGEAFNVFIRQNILDYHRSKYVVFYGHLESRVAAVENLERRRFWP